MEKNIEKLSTVGRDGLPYEFKVEYELREPNPFLLVKGVWPKHSYKIRSLDETIIGHYQFTVIELDDSVRVTEMFGSAR